MTPEKPDQPAGQLTPPASHSDLGARETLRMLLMEAIVRRFERLAGPSVSVWVVDHMRFGLEDGAPHYDAIDTPAAPLCAGCTDLQPCIGAWLTSLRELSSRPEPHRHDCPLQHRCSVVPVLWQSRPLAACKLVCSVTVSEEEFTHHVELLDVLVENFQTRQTQLLAEVAARSVDPTPASGPAEAPSPQITRPFPRHPQVNNAMSYIDVHLADPKMTVARIAEDLKINSTYLSHLFAEQVGTRMSRYIAQARVEMAKKLLATTNWQVKRVAYESGYNNADWFSQAFHAHVGMTPGQYRRAARAGTKRG